MGRTGAANTIAPFFVAATVAAAMAAAFASATVFIQANERTPAVQILATTPHANTPMAANLTNATITSRRWAGDIPPKVR